VNWVFTGKDLIHQQRTPTDMFLNSVVPMAYQEMVEAARKDLDMGPAIGAALADVVGVGAQVYEDSKTRVRLGIRRAQEKGDIEEAEEKTKRWDLKHPEDKMGEVSSVKEVVANRKKDAAYKAMRTAVAKWDKNATAEAMEILVASGVKLEDVTQSLKRAGFDSQQGRMAAEQYKLALAKYRSNKSK